jgi:hypothetical protein
MAWLQKKNLKKLNDRKDQYRIVDDGIHHRSIIRYYKVEQEERELFCFMKKSGMP